MDIITVLKVAIAVLAFFGASIFVHEFGHYWMARRLGMKVDAFAIGFGPKIFGWTRDGIEYSWRWIPAGGYVKLPQMITSEALEGDKLPEDAQVPPAPPLHKILVAMAGPFMNIIFAFCIGTLIYFTGLPVLVNPSVIGYVDPSSEEAKLGIKEGDVVVEVNGSKVKSWQDANVATFLAQTNVLPVVIDRAGVHTTYHLTARVNENLHLKMLDLNPKDHPEITEVKSEGAAAAAGLKVKDVIISFAGAPIGSAQQLTELIKKSADKECEIVVERAKEKLTLKVKPKLDSSANVGRIGVGLGNSSVTVYELQRPGPLPWDQIYDVWDKTAKTLNALFHSKQTGVGISDLSGPPGILAMLAAQLNTDYRLALSFLVLLNVNLAILNMLPIPVLDGGHILMSIVEKIRNRPMSAKFVEYTTTVFAVLLISLMLFVSFNDFKRFRLFKSMFQGETRVEEKGASGSGSGPAK